MSAIKCSDSRALRRPSTPWPRCRTLALAGPRAECSILEESSVPGASSALITFATGGVLGTAISPCPAAAAAAAAVGGALGYRRVVVANNALLGLAVAGGVAVVIASRKKSKKPAKPKKPGVSGFAVESVTWVPPSDAEPPVESGKEGAACPKSVAGANNLGVWDGEGSCVVYWEGGVTDEALRVMLRAEFERRGRPDGICEGDQFAEHQDAFVPNKHMVELVATVLAEYYSQPVGAFPPTEGNPISDVDGSPLWIHHAWNQTYALALDELCSFVAVT